jgi:predicted RNA methylase
VDPKSIDISKEISKDVRKLNGDGDFRSEECIELLKQADIVVTNPPFSLFREFVAQLMTYKKQFIILGNMNAITCKEIFLISE